MGEFTFLVFQVVASVAATLMALFAAGVGAVLMYSPGEVPHRVDREAPVASAERYAA